MFYAHFLKTYLAEGVVQEQPQLIVDPEGDLRDRNYWLKFLPAVLASSKGQASSAESKEEKKNEESKSTENLEIAWRYKNIEGEKPLGDEAACSYKFDNSKSMGDAYANEPSSRLNRETLMHLPYNRRAN